MQLSRVLLHSPSGVLSGSTRTDLPTADNFNDPGAAISNHDDSGLIKLYKRCFKPSLWPVNIVPINTDQVWTDLSGSGGTQLGLGLVSSLLVREFFYCATNIFIFYVQFNYTDFCRLFIAEEIKA
ncbi:unnamed protein product [Protopolystoma xenopodis]|uniref:Uncharacterized protein n=1 Tax=Protopolystoma xenopodis TaxID=117903 RepID=A0A3S5A4X0_9PLAT|nr:unnamed protein product [Protopolystoma xenopodis]